MSPADVIRLFLTHRGIAVTGSRLPSHDDWGIVTGPIADGPASPDNFIGITNTGSYYDGRIMRGGQVRHPSVQIMVRSLDETVGWDKGVQIETLLEKVGMFPQDGGLGKVQIGNQLLEAVTISTSLMKIGQEEKNRRLLFSINARMTLTSV